MTRSSAARAVARLSAFLADFQDDIGEAEINPLAVLERGVTALDCAIVPRETRSGGTRRTRANRP